jgi:hypothetical protein
MASIALSTIDSAIATRIAAQLTGFKEAASISSLLRTPSSVFDKAFVISFADASSLDGSPRGLRQKELSRIGANLSVEFSRKLNKNQPTTRRVAYDNAEAIIKALLDTTWTGSIGSGGPRFIFQNYRFEFSRDGEAIIGIVNFQISYELSLT